MPRPNELSEFEKGYVSGLFEGEGCLSMSENKRKYTRGRNGKKYATIRVYYNCQLSITNNNLKLLKYAQYIIGGHIRLKYKGNEKHKKGYILSLTKQEDILWLLEIIFPYLIEKKIKAELTIKWCKRRIEPGKHRQIYSNADIELFKSFKEVCYESSTKRA